MTKRLALLTIVSLLLAACATEQAVQVNKAESVEKIAVEAESAARSGNVDKALASLRAAAGAHPADKLPWLTTAQIQFDQGKYGDAIVAALAALERDPHDKLANSIVTVSGLRLSTAALAELVQKNGLSSNTRSEAQELARLLRNNLGEDVLVPQPAAKPVIRTAVRPPIRKAAQGALKSEPAGAGDPFGSLK